MRLSVAGVTCLLGACSLLAAPADFRFSDMDGAIPDGGLDASADAAARSDGGDAGSECTMDVDCDGSATHEVLTCVSGACVFARCADGFDNCDGAIPGCEADLSQAAHCRSCRAACAGDTPLCGSTGCVATCDASEMLCSPTECADLSTSLLHCGMCGRSCTGLDATWGCVAGTCEIDRCTPGFVDCDAMDSTGCEANTQTSLLHCGRCENPCPDGCVAGLCDPVVEVAGSVSRMCARRTSGRVSCWGYTLHGLGDGTALLSGVPVEVLDPVGGALRATSIASGEEHSCAVGGDQLLYCWGRGANGALGSGAISDRLVPSLVVSEDVRFAARRFTRVVAGYGSSTCAIDTLRDLWCWGHNASGQIGNGSTTDALSAVRVTLPAPTLDVALGASHTCALLDDGTLRCWGANASGQLGDGTFGARTTPTPVSLTGVRDVEAGHFSTCAVTTSNELHCWGLNAVGQLGSGGTANLNIPTRASALPASVIAVMMGYEHTCATSTTGIHRCAGSRVFDQFEPGNTVPAPTGATLFAFSYGGCSLSAGLLRCWGRDEFGQLGRTEHNLYVSPTAMVGSGIQDIALGDSHGCYTDASGARCFGRAMHGQLGLGGASASGLPRTTTVVTGFSRVSASENYSCGISSGQAYCWGLNLNGRLGDGTMSPRAVPTLVALAGTETDIATGYDHACAITSAGGVVCWGDNSAGQLGRGSVGAPDATPGAPVGGISDVVEVRAGQDFSCARHASGRISCWGLGTSGQLGNGASASSATAVEVTGITAAIDLAVGEAHACAIIGATVSSPSGSVVCWGSNAFNAVRSGSATPPVITPAAISGGISDAVSIGLGESHSCLVRSGGEMYCWGRNAWYELGDGTAIQRAVPTRVVGVSDAARLAGGGYNVRRTCFVRTDGTAACFGMAWEGQCGSGEVLRSATSAPVMGLP